MSKLKLGVIGLSDGNGHPYSWSAIFNGFDSAEMARCPFPAIPEYLSRQNFPEDFLSDRAEVTHIWTQDRELSKRIASASKISHVIEQMEDLIGQVDAVLLARDDAEFHVAMSLPFLKAGLPVFVDKPFAVSVKDAQRMFSAQLYDGQIFTCSSLRYAKELQLSDKDTDETGDIFYAEGTVMKRWETYGIHILEPIVSQLPERGPLVSVSPWRSGEMQVVVVEWKNCRATLKVTGKIPSPITLTFFGKKNFKTKTFSDSFSCFRASLKTFVDGITFKRKTIETKEVLEMVEILEKGKC